MTGPFYKPMKMSDFAERELERMHRQMRDSLRGSFVSGNSPSTYGDLYPRGSDEDHALSVLRKKVSQWIVSADKTGFSDIIGNEAALAELRAAVMAPVKHKTLYDKYGLTMPKGALLLGPPGCGKTMFGRAVATEMSALYGTGVEFLSIPASALQSPYVGKTEEYIRDIFAYSRAYAKAKGHPLLIFIDEAEVILPDRTGKRRNVHSWEESQVATFLTEMDGVVASGAFVLLATNQPDKIDEAILREGRCDIKIKVTRPTPETAVEILTANFGTMFAKDSRSELVFAAAEALFDPHKIFATAQAITRAYDGKITTKGKDFTLGHIVSGAMVASIPLRASRIAFMRDQADGTVTGVTVADVLECVNRIFDENQLVDHSFAKQEFIAEYAEELEAAAAPKGRMN